MSFKPKLHILWVFKVLKIFHCQILTQHTRFDRNQYWDTKILKKYLRVLTIGCQYIEGLRVCWTHLYTYARHSGEGMGVEGAPQYAILYAIYVCYTRVMSKNCCSPADSNSCQKVPSQARYHWATPRGILIFISRAVFVVLIAHSIALSLPTYSIYCTEYTRISFLRIIHYTSPSFFRYACTYAISLWGESFIFLTTDTAFKLDRRSYL